MHTNVCVHRLQFSRSHLVERIERLATDLPLYLWEITKSSSIFLISLGHTAITICNGFLLPTNEWFKQLCKNQLLLTLNLFNAVTLVRNAVYWIYCAKNYPFNLDFISLFLFFFLSFTVQWSIGHKIWIESDHLISN